MPQNTSPFLPLSQLPIWQWQKDFFQQQGIKAWQEAIVPHFITNNAFIAQQYAHLIFAFLRDFARLYPDNQEKIYFVELGAGSGRLAYHTLQCLTKMCEKATFPVPQFCYVLTDFPENTLHFWRNHPLLQKFFAQNLLDIAHLEVETSTELYLQISGKIIQKGSLNTPLFLIANYFFDSIPQELIYAKEGHLYEVYARVETTDNQHYLPQDLLENAQLSFHYREEEIPYFSNHYLNEVVHEYKSLKKSHILFPKLAIAFLERIRGFSKNGMFLLSADKGEHLLEKMDNIGKPMLTQHGSFSLSVNYHAITQYYQLQKALVFNAYYVGNLNVTFIAMHKQPNQWKELSLAFELFMQDFNPESYFITKKHFEKHLNDMNFRQMIAYIKLSHFDARFFKQCIPSIFSFLPRLNPFEKKHLCQILERVWQMYYPIGESHDLGFDIGVILYQIDYYQDALFYFQYSEKNYRENAPLYFNIASCYFQLEDDIKCSEYIAKTLILESTHQGALELYEQLNRIKK